MTTTSYLIQRDANRLDKSGRPQFLAIVGRIAGFDDGYRFFPSVVARHGSRKSHPSILKAIPKWADALARKHGYGDIVSADELRELKA